jgi:hypothetical protein
LLVKGHYLDANSSPLSALLQADNITAIAVGTHQGGIKPANCQFHLFGIHREAVNLSISYKLT